MKKWIVLMAALAWGLDVRAQDLGWLVEQAPTVSKILVKALERAPAFSARIEVNVSGAADPIPSSASGSLEYQTGSVRWEVKLGDVKSAQLSQNARAIVRQLNGDQFILLTRADVQANYVVLPGAQAYLQQALPDLKPPKSKTPLGSETIDGHPCAKEGQRLAEPNGTAIDVAIWRAKDLKNLPIQVQVTESGETIRLLLRDVRLRSIGPDRFRLPGGLTKYNNVEDLVQTVVLERVKKRMGL